MIKLVITSDWHLGNSFHGFDRTEDHRHYFHQLSSLIKSEQPDALLVGGDIFDNGNPSATSQRLYFEFLKDITEQNKGLQVVIIAGNHDSAYRLEAPSPLLELSRITVVGTVGRDNDGEVDWGKMAVPVGSIATPGEQLCCLAIPYLRDGDLPQADTYSQGVRLFVEKVLAEADKKYGTAVPKVMLAHLYANGSEIAEGSSERIVVGGSEQVDFDSVSPEIAYVALGHIHRRQRVAGRDNMRYCGSALPMSFTERGYKHGADILQVQPDGSCTLSSRDFDLLHPLLSFPEKALPWEEVEKKIAELPGEDDPQAVRCYLQLNVLMQGADPALSDKVEKALEGKKVWLCKIQAAYPAGEDEAEMDDLRSIEVLQQLSPGDMIRKIYKARFRQDLPAELQPLVRQVVREAEKHNEEN